MYISGSYLLAKLSLTPNMECSCPVVFLMYPLRCYSCTCLSVVQMCFVCCGCTKWSEFYDRQGTVTVKWHMSYSLHWLQVTVLLPTTCALDQLVNPIFLLSNLDTSKACQDQTTKHIESIHRLVDTILVAITIPSLVHRSSLTEKL